MHLLTRPSSSKDTTFCRELLLGLSKYCLGCFHQRDVVLPVSFTSDFDDLNLRDDDSPIDLHQQEGDVFQVITK